MRVLRVENVGEAEHAHDNYVPPLHVLHVKRPQSTLADRLRVELQAAARKVLQLFLRASPR